MYGYIHGNAPGTTTTVLADQITIGKRGPLAHANDGLPDPRRRTLAKPTLRGMRIGRDAKPPKPTSKDSEDSCPASLRRFVATSRLRAGSRRLGWRTVS